MPRKKSWIWDIPNTEFEKIVKRNKHVVDILEELGFSRASGSMAKVIKDRISRDGIDVSHMSKTHGKGAFPKYPLSEILIKNSKYTNITQLKKRLVTEGIMEYKCVLCDNRGTWLSMPMVLQLDHIDGDNRNHEITNIRFLCPNCHSQTHNYSGKNIKARDKSYQITINAE